MDFFAQVNERLLQPPEPKSELRAYFEAHLLFQGEYHSPPTSPETSPEPEERPTRPTLSHRGKKRKHDSDDEGYTSGGLHRVPSKRRRALTPSLALGVRVAPSPPVTDDSVPQSPTSLRRVETQDSAFHEDEEEKDGQGRDHGHGGFAPVPLSHQQHHHAANRKRWNSPPVMAIYGPQGTTRKTRAMQPRSMQIGRYSLRWTAARAARRADG